MMLFFNIFFSLFLLPFFFSLSLAQKSKLYSRQGPLMAPLVLLTTNFDRRGVFAMCIAYLLVMLSLQRVSCVGIEACFPSSRGHYFRAAQAIDRFVSAAMGVAASVAATSRATVSSSLSPPPSAAPTPSSLPSRLSEETACFRVMGFIFSSTTAVMLLFDAMSRASPSSPVERKKKEREKLLALQRRRRREQRRRRRRDGGDSDESGGSASPSGSDLDASEAPPSMAEPAEGPWRLSLLVANSPWVALATFTSWLGLALLDDSFHLRGGGRVGFGSGGSTNSGTQTTRVSHFGAKPCSSGYSFLGNSASFFGPRL